MKKLSLTFAFLIGSITSAFAACTPPAVMHDFPGTAFNMSMATAADGNCASSITLQSGGAASGSFSSGAFASGAYASGSIGSGAMVDLGAIADAAATTGSTGSISAKMRLMTTQLNTLNTTLGTPFQAGGSIGNTTFAVTNAGTFAVQLSGATNNINNISGTISLPTGASTSANQTNKTQLTQLTDGTSAATTYTSYGTAPTGAVPGANVFVTNVNANGQATAANSSPVVLPAAQVTADPCTLGTKTNFTFGAATGTIQIVAPSGSTQVYVCSMSLVAAATAVVSMVGGTGASCTTGTPVAALGSTTAASGMSLAANGGYTFGNGGGTAFRTTTAGHGMCIVQSGTTALAGGGTFVQQ